MHRFLRFAGLSALALTLGTASLAAESENPDSAELQYSLGLAHEKERRYRAAAEHFRRALELKPSLHSARAPYGWCLYYLGRPERARQEFEAYLATAPTDSRALFALGLIEFDADRLDPARGSFLQALEAARSVNDPAWEALLRARLADVELRAGQLEAARRLLVVAIGKDPENPAYYFKLARVLERIGDDDGARRVLALREALARAKPAADR